MYNPDEYSDLIQEHLKGLSTSEQNVFVANELNTNQDFKEQYANEKMVFNAIVLSELFDLENTIRNFEPKPKKTSPWIFLGALVGVALLVTGAYKAYDLRNTPISNIEKVILTTPIIATETQIDSV